MIAFAIRNPLLTLAASFALALAGLWAWRHVPVDAIPDLSDNQAIVWAEWPGKSAEDVDQQITVRLSRELQGLPGVRTVRGMSLYGAAYVYVIFADRLNLYDCRTRVLERLAQLQGVLPPGVTPRLGPDATAMGQVFAFSLQGPRDTEARRHVLDHLVLPALRSLPGVAEVAPAGGVSREYQIDLDPQRLEAQGLSLMQVMEAVKAAGRDVGAMSVEQSGIETMIRGAGFLRSLEDVENIVVKGDPMKGAGLRLRDIATVQIGGQVRQGVLADATGEQVGAIVALRVGEDPKRVIASVKAALAELAPALNAESLTPVPFYDRSQLIEETNATVVSALEEAIITTVIVVLLFLLHLRASLATAVSLPLGMLFSFLVMHLFGVSANLMSLAGIAIAIGVMVDFGIIMTENITQHLVDLKERCAREGRPMPVSPWNEEITLTVIAAAREVARPLVTSAATTVIGFLPIFVLTDQAGRLFIPLAVTKTLAISGAVLVGIFLVPLLCRLLLPPWQVRRTPLLVMAGMVAAALFCWYWNSGYTLPMDHGRWSVVVPGWLFAPAVAALGASAIWRLGRERLVSYEDNPTSRFISLAYDWAYSRLLRHKQLFAATLVVLALGGYLIGLGWERLSTPLRAAFTFVGADLRETRVDAAMRAAFPGIGSSFLPPLDEGSLLFMPSVPATAGLGETQRVLMIQNAAIAAVPEVAGLMGKLGRAETALDPAPIGMIETVVLLKPYRDWPTHAILKADGTEEQRPRTLREVRDALAAATDLPGVAPSWLQPIETRVVMLSTGIRSLMALQVLGDNLVDLEHFAEAAEKVVQRVPGAADAQMQRESGKPYTEIRLDSARLARFGLSAETVMEAVESAIGGMPLAISVEGTLRYPVRLRYARELRDDPDELLALRIPTGMGAATGSVALESLLVDGRLHHTIGPMAIRSENGKRTQYVMFNARDAAEVDVVRAADERLRAAIASGEVPMPSGVSWRWVGRYEQKLKADQTLGWVMAASLGIMIVLIYLGTRSWLITAVIVGCNATVTTAGGFFLVKLWGAELTTAVSVGFLVLLGVMFNDGILLGTYLQEQFRTAPRDLNDVHRRVFLAGLRRRRPALMTNLTTLLSLVPVLWATGRGAEVMQPMVLPVIGGMTFDLVSLFSVPVFYAWWWERKLRLSAQAA
ncbi:efflux RND transporter permease subunit [Nibricoccus sp. IMCC34717]|uniref:efflux RND transporter permease subunit n=1 Tax=Nibricoccus sp. IMCC34717 TaxID=3034021 RepID=UPI00384DCCEC